MCGRFAQLGELRAVKDRYGVETPPPGSVQPRYNLSPGQPAAAVTALDGRRRLDFLSWGLVPSWAKDIKIGQRLINARAETVWEKPSYKNALRYRRCVVPADGFYEWAKTRGSAKQPYFIQRVDGELLALAGLWESWSDRDGGELFTFTLLTRAAHPFMKRFHDRMPLILERGEDEQWLDHRLYRPDDLSPLLRAGTSVKLHAVPVSSRVNYVREEGPECIVPVGDTMTEETPWPPPPALGEQKQFDW